MKKTFLHIFLFLCAFMMHTDLCYAQTLSTDIRLNQLGFYPLSRKIAVVVNSSATLDSFHITLPDLTTKVYSGKLSDLRNVEVSTKKTRIAEFTALTTPGNYVLIVPSLGYSYQFTIADNIHDPVAKALLKAFYYQRTAIDLLPQYAGQWSRAAGHYDTSVFIHSSAATALLPTGTIVSSSKGWYDAGDYNKYIVNSGFTMGTLLSLYESFPAYFQNQNLNIPESGNTIPDILDESLWNLRWMLTMQDTADGGVFHKLTDTMFYPAAMPATHNNDRYIVQKSTAASLDFAACMAQAARIFSKFQSQLPGLSDSCIHAAVKAWKWARNNRTRYYNQDTLNKYYDPNIVTGKYDDIYMWDEFVWAATELYITTQVDSFYNPPGLTIRPSIFAQHMQIPKWNKVQVLAYETIVRFKDSLATKYTKANTDFNTIKQFMLALCDTLTKNIEQRSFMTVIGRNSSDFDWGSNGFAASQAIVLLSGYKLTDSVKYLKYALSNLDYILGRNGTGYSFVTGYGDKTPMDPHHRLSRADGITQPVPGLVPGGANGVSSPASTSGCPYPSNYNEKYIDSYCSASTNEPSINISASVAFLANAMEVYQALLDESSTILSVKLLSFTGERDKTIAGKNNLKWKLSDNTGLLYVDVERSTNGTSFEKLSEVKSASQNSFQAEYSFSDFNAPGIAFYRLKIVEKDGRHTYSNIIRLVAPAGKAEVHVYPNPAKDRITVSHSGASQTASLRLVSLAGVQLGHYNIKPNSDVSYLDVSFLSPGIYIIELHGHAVVSRVLFTKF